MKKKFRLKKANDDEAAKLALREIMGLKDGERLPETFHVESDGGLTKNSCTVIAPVGSQQGDILIVTSTNGGEVFQMEVPQGVVESDKFEVNLNTYEPIYGIVGRALLNDKPESAMVITDDNEIINTPQYRRKPEILSRPSWGLEKTKVARSLSTDEANRMWRSFDDDIAGPAWSVDAGGQQASPPSAMRRATKSKSHKLQPLGKMKSVTFSEDTKAASAAESDASITVTFSNPGPLGFVLEQDYDGPITIDHVTTDAPPETLERLHSGMVLTHVQGVCIKRHSFEDVLDKIRGAGRPLDLKFRPGY